MKNSFEQIDEIIDSLVFICDDKTLLPQIEKDMLLSKLRQAYSHMMKIQVFEDEEFINNKKEDTSEKEKCDSVPEVAKPIEASIPKTAPKMSVEPEATPKIKVEPQKMVANFKQNPKPVAEKRAQQTNNEDMKSDFDLFFDPDQDKVQTSGSDELHVIRTEIESEVVNPINVHEPEPIIEENLSVNAIPDQSLEVDSTSESKPDQVIEPEPMEDDSEEDDILQFIPTQKNSKKTPIESANGPKKPVHNQPVAPQTASNLQSAPATRSLNDLFNERKEDHSLVTQFQHTKVKDLTKAISINDKFTFIRELFNNRGEEFSAAIQRLNQCRDIEEAFDLLEEYKKHYFWDSTANAYLSLCDLIRRKYA